MNPSPIVRAARGSLDWRRVVAGLRCARRVWRVARVGRIGRIGRIGIGLVMLAAACACAAPARRPPTAKDCQADVGAGRWGDAARRCAAVFDATGDEVIGRLVAEVHLTLDDPDRAIATADRFADRLYARWVKARAERARNPRLALAHATRLVLDSTRAGERFWIAYGAFAQAGAAKALGEYALAERALTLADDSGHDRFTSQLARVNVLRAAGDFDEARRLAQDAVDSAPALGLERAPSARVEALMQLALVQLESGNHGAAGLALREVARDAELPDLIGGAATNRADIADELGRCREASLHLHLAHLSEGDSFDFLFLAGRVALHCGDLGAAERRLRDAYARRPTEGPYRWRVFDVLGELAERRQDLALAERHYQTAITEVEELRRDGGRLEAIVAGKLVEPYEHAIDLAARRGDWRAALALVLRHEQGADRPGAADAAAAAWRGHTLAILVRGRDRVWRIDVAGGQVGGDDLGPIPRLGAIDLLATGDAAATAIVDRLGAALPRPERGPLHVDLVGDLALVPLAALRRGDDRVIAHTALVRVVRIAPDPRPRATGTALVVLGDPATAADPTASLPGARSEALWVADRLAVTPQLGPAVTRAALAAARDAALLHVASHATWTLDGPSLPLADGAVTAADLAALAPAPRLVVLASCFSARARDRGGLTSLAAGFLDAGAAVVISTQTSVDDDDARRLVEAFYRHGGAADPAEALRRAQLELATAGVDPHEWASFVAIAAPPPPAAP